MAYKRVRRKDPNSKNGYTTTTYNTKTGKTTRSYSTVSIVGNSRTTRTHSYTQGGKNRDTLTTNMGGWVTTRSLNTKSKPDQTFKLIQKATKHIGRTRSKGRSASHSGENGLVGLMKIFLFLFGILIVVGLFQ